jgi:hypothetical protein
MLVVIPGAVLLVAAGMLATAEVRQVTSRAQDVAVLCSPAISESVVVIGDTSDEVPLPEALRAQGLARSGVFTDDAFGTLFLNQRLAVGCQEATHLRRVEIALVVLALAAVIPNALVARLKAGRILRALELLIVVALGVLAVLDGPVVSLAIAALASLAHHVGFRGQARPRDASS